MVYIVSVWESSVVYIVSVWESSVVYIGSVLGSSVVSFSPPNCYIADTQYQCRTVWLRYTFVTVQRVVLEIFLGFAQLTHYMLQHE